MADSGALVVTESRQQQQQHPLSQIAESGTHRLLLKQWVKEEDLLARRVALREARLDGARKEIAFLYCAFFAFHAASVLLLFLSSASTGSASAAACKRSWIPCLVSLLSSLAMLWALRYKSDTEAVLERMLAREREDALLLARCVSELKRKGIHFDLLKEVDALRRAKSLRVEAKGGADKPRRWQTRDLAVFALFAAACGVLVLTRFLLCN
ncbi:hypothetical protein BDA96_01G072700 [Sorghum bicolor]|jgi:hypothetical protein|uniref:Uncharacterized protein n=2 Tax=Sorghum bicolor TaxID=4558 RepID=A0A921RWY6_SORBI|nr:uncharacterized protein LOC8083937 [Sorghum bicolor]EER93357.1 hypothetical protein SORBI_3001G070300 [Sorghum bicolor]KAG0547355.1 hypothetical protein BDA96_01G072700 [Sorghum bicolor]|eukprot:XP_002466359.1 uncharacterized protein LOC8083937 [Sorghum bicolor]